MFHPASIKGGYRENASLLQNTQKSEGMPDVTIPSYPTGGSFGRPAALAAEDEIRQEIRTVEKSVRDRDYQNDIGGIPQGTLPHPWSSSTMQSLEKAYSDFS